MFCKVLMPGCFHYSPVLEIYWLDRCCQIQVFNVVEVSSHHFSCLSRLYSTQYFNEVPVVAFGRSVVLCEGQVLPLLTYQTHQCFHEAPVVTFGISVVFCEGQVLPLLTYRTNPCFLGILARIHYLMGGL